MKLKMPHDFRERLAFSEGVELTRGILAHLYENIPGATDVVKANEDDDRNGTDYWISRKGLPAISVDMKNREFCPIERFNSDDACIETCSVFQNGQRKKIGWTLDHGKRTELIVYTWPHANGRRFWVLYFPLLCAAAQRHFEEWKNTYGERPTPNRGYQTLNVYVPRTVIARAIRDLAGGVVETKKNDNVAWLQDYERAEAKYWPT